LWHVYVTRICCNLAYVSPPSSTIHNRRWVAPQYSRTTFSLQLLRRIQSPSVHIPPPRVLCLSTRRQGKTVYKPENSRRLAGSVTEIFRYDMTTPVPNLMPPSRLNVNEPPKTTVSRKGHSRQGKQSSECREENGGVGRFTFGSELNHSKSSASTRIGWEGKA